MDPFMGQIMAVAFNFPPVGWLQCSGQMMSIAQNSALYALLGTTYGGDGRTTFGIPNLNGRMVIGTGQGAGTSSYVPGEMAGSETVTLNQTQLPMHTHTATFSGAGSSFSASSAIQGDTVFPVANATLGRAVDKAPNGTSKPAIYTPAGSATDTALDGLNVAGTVSIQPTGGSSPVSVLSPFIALPMIIAVQGVFPSRQ